MDRLEAFQELITQVDFDIGGSATPFETRSISTIAGTGDVTTEEATAAVGALRGQYTNLGIAPGEEGAVGLTLASLERVAPGTARQATTLLNRFGITGADEVTGILDLLFRQSVSRGVPLEELFQAFEGDARALDQFGLPLPQQAELILDTLAAGIDFGAIGGGLEEARIVAGEEGVDPLVIINRVANSIVNAETAQDAFAIAVDWFGETDAFGVVTALRTGKVNFGDQLFATTLNDRTGPGTGLLGSVGITQGDAAQSTLDAALLSGTPLEQLVAGGASLLADVPGAGGVVESIVANFFGGDLEFGITNTAVNDTNAVFHEIYGDVQEEIERLEASEQREEARAVLNAAVDQYVNRIIASHFPAGATALQRLHVVSIARRLFGLPEAEAPPGDLSRVTALPVGGGDQVSQGIAAGLPIELATAFAGGDGDLTLTQLQRLNGNLEALIRELGSGDTTLPPVKPGDFLPTAEETFKQTQGPRFF